MPHWIRQCKNGRRECKNMAAAGILCFVTRIQHFNFKSLLPQCDPAHPYQNDREQSIPAERLISSSSTCITSLYKGNIWHCHSDQVFVRIPAKLLISSKRNHRVAASVLHTRMHFCSWGWYLNSSFSAFKLKGFTVLSQPLRSRPVSLFSFPSQQVWWR